MSGRGSRRGASGRPRKRRNNRSGMDTLKQDLLRALECPVCFECMLPPITLCCNGHNICNTCKPGLENCPTCRGDFLDVRNKCAEDLSGNIKHPCKFRKSGCEREFRVGPKEEHERVCRYGPHKCPLYFVGRCQWEGTAEDIKQHIEGAHEEEIMTIIIQGMNSFHNPDYISRLGDIKWTKIVFTLNKIFFYFSKIIGDLLYMCYMYVGSREDKNNYKYTISIKTSGGDQSATLCLRCPNYLDFIDGNFPNEKCAVFYKDFTKQCVGKDDRLAFEFEISEN